MKHDLTGQTFLVLGMGKSGLGATRLLLRHGAEVIAADDRELRNLDAVNKLVENEEIEFVNSAASVSYDTLILSPGISATHDTVARAFASGKVVMGELELAYHFLAGPIAALTGSNGKTTTTTLVGLMLKAAGVACQVGGNIGVAVTEMAQSSEVLQWNVLEASSFQLESTERFHPQIAAVVNVTPNHLDRHGDFETYRVAKGKIFANQKAADWAVLNAADEGSRSFASGLKSRVASFGGEEAHLADGAIELFGSRLMSAKDVRIPGAHNLENVMAAAIVSYLAGAKREDIANVAVTFEGVPHRLEFVREWRGIRFYNDSKATSVDATMKALAALNGPLWVVLGGRGKGGSYRPLLPLLAEKAKSALLIGEDAARIEADISGQVSCKFCSELSRAVEYAAAEARSGDTVLLAPACASYDQFQSYEQRGNSFRDLVNAL